MQVLAKAFVIAKKKSFIGAKGSAERSSELVALKRRGGTLVEEIGSIEGIVAQKFESGAMQLVAARPCDDEHLSAWTFAEVGAVRIALDVEFAHRVHAQEHAARPSRRHVVFGGPGKLHSVEQKKILLRTVSRDGEIVGGRRVRDACAAGFL